MNRLLRFLYALFRTTAFSLALVTPALAERPSITNLLFVGDSITAGVGVSNKSKRYATQATAALQATHPAIVEINRGQSARALCQMSADYPTRLLATKPDAVVVQWGVNDHYWGFSVGEFLRRYDGLVAALRSAKPNMPIVLATLIADFRFEGAPDRWIAEANVGIQEIAARHRCRVAHTHRALGQDRQTCYRDTIHPNDEGATRMAKAIETAFASQPIDQEAFRLVFDPQIEARVQRFVFHAPGDRPTRELIEVDGFGLKGFILRSPRPLSVRTPNRYPKNTLIKIRILAADGRELNVIEAKSNWAGMLSYTIDPASEAEVQVIVGP